MTLRTLEMKSLSDFPEVIWFSVDDSDIRDIMKRELKTLAENHKIHKQQFTHSCLSSSQLIQTEKCVWFFVKCLLELNGCCCCVCLHLINVLFSNAMNNLLVDSATKFHCKIVECEKSCLRDVSIIALIRCRLFSSFNWDEMKF